MKTNLTNGNLKAVDFSVYDENGPIATAFVSTKDRYIGEEEAKATAKLFAQSTNMLYTLNDLIQCEYVLMNQLPEGIPKEQLKTIMNAAKKIMEDAQ